MVSDCPNFYFMKLINENLFLLLAIVLLAINADSQQTADGTIRGRVIDAQRSLVAGAGVTTIGSRGIERTVQTNEKKAFKARSEKIRAEMERKIPSADKLSEKV